MENENLAPLSRGEWESLIYAASGSTRGLILRLAIHHHAIDAPASPKDCPLCGPEAHRPVAAMPAAQIALADADLRAEF
jgi:hypothetical protein